MTHALKIAAVLAFALPASVGFAAQTAPSPDQQAKYEDEAQKSCSYDLDHDRFGAYSSMEECVADRAHTLARRGQMNAAGGANPSA